jgi:hypothetical protein
VACSPEWLVVPLSGGGRVVAGSQVAVRVSMSVTLGGSRTTQALSELIQQSSALIMCSEREREEEKKLRKRWEPSRMAVSGSSSSAWMSGAVLH